MYIIKNALKCISRSLGRNILIGIITLVIATSACLGLSIRQASESAKEKTLDGLSITATISYDRGSVMEQLGEENFTPPSRGEGGFGGFDRDKFSSMMGDAKSLTLDEYKKYATADSVKDFYYTISAYFDGYEIDPVTTETESSDSTESSNSTESSRFPGGMGGMMGMMGGGGFTTGDFTIMGYSNYYAMTDFVNGNASILEGGEMFEDSTTELTCVISKELSDYNGGISVGDKIVIVNPSLESETYTLTVSGLYTSDSNNDFSMSMFGSSQDPANRIYMSADALQTILDASEAASTTITDETTGRESDSAISGTLSATYVFADPESYNAFEAEARALGLDESYTISSSDVKAYENSLTPLNTLSTMAGWFLLVIIAIGGIILIVLNIFNVRDRKYEVGVLTAMGMKKGKVALQFMCEILIVTMVSVTLGAAIGAVSSVPVTNALLAGQIESENSQVTQIEENFGRPGEFENFGGSFGGFGGGMPPEMNVNMPQAPGSSKPENVFEDVVDKTANYISEVDSAMNLTVVFQMLGVGLFLTLVSGVVSVLFIMRYDPLKILANRD